MPDLTDREKRRNKVLEAMPWYDELHPDFTELDAVLDELAAPALPAGLVERECASYTCPAGDIRIRSHTHFYDLPAGLPDVERAELLKALIEEARYIRGRLTKVTLADYAAILAALEGSATLPSDRKPWQHPRLGVAALRESTTEDILAEAKTQEYCGDCDGTGWVEGGETIKTTCERCKGSGFEPDV